MERRITSNSLVVSSLALSLPCAGLAQEADPDALAKALSNPVSSLISVPFQYNYDETFGDDGRRHTLNVQPVIPLSISEDWNLISRTIIPVIDQENVIPGTDQFGFGDVLQSAFFSPKEPSESGLIWGVGPVALLPTGTGELSADSWAVGPTVVILKQQANWTYGALLNHLVDVGGAGERTDISSTFVQPFATRNLGAGRTVSFNTESTYDWEAEEWTVPVNVTYSKVSRIGGQLVSYVIGVRGYVDAPAGGPNWGLRFQLTLLYPK